MVVLFRSFREQSVRPFDSGNWQELNDLRNIIGVGRYTPDIRIRLPLPGSEAVESCGEDPMRYDHPHLGPPGGADR